MNLKPFPYIFVRTPFFPLNYTKPILNSSCFNEGIFLASPDLYAEKDKDSKKMSISLNKYVSRSKARPTPFGLFAGCSLAVIGDETDILLSNQANYKRSTRLDMDYLSTLIQHLERDIDIRKQLRYFPNNSIYKLGNKVRYVEYILIGSIRMHQLSSIDMDEYVSVLLDRSQQGATIEQLGDLIIDEDISNEDAIEFIHDLIDNQLLKSELDVSVTSPEGSLCRLINQLKNIKGVDNIKQNLNDIFLLLNKIDNQKLGTGINIYDDIITKIKQIGVSYNPRFLFQTDLYKPTQRAFISRDIIDNLQVGLSFLNKIAIRKQQNNNIELFKKMFYERYEERVIPLSEALDKELGIGYPVNISDSDKNPLINGIVVAEKHNMTNLGLNDWGISLLKKYVEAMRNKEPCIVLTDGDVKDTNANWDNSSASISVFCEVISENSIYIKGCSGNAVRTIARFCHLDNDIDKMVKEIALKEQETYPDSILAEIVHLPQSRIGNVVYRPIIRDYEIPYLCAPGIDQEHIIPITDLILSMSNGQLILSSKKLKKEIRPRLSSAHNYNYNSLPIYYFLCDMQNPEERVSFDFSWGGLSQIFDYLPRVVYKNCILSKQRWIIQKGEIQKWLKYQEKELLIKVTEYRKKQNIPERIAISDSDNKLFIDMTNILDIETLLSIAKKRDDLIIEEFLFDEKNVIVKGPEGLFTNEMIVSFYKSN